MSVTLHSKIPDWDIHGVLPPIRPGQDGTSPDRSPYHSSMHGLCLRFGLTKERRDILRGLIALREALRSTGLGDGFQWIDGSFAEDVETTRGRPPGDIDVVTFVALGDAARQGQLVAAHPELFHSQLAKQRYLVDHYFFATDVGFDAQQANWVAYWYSMWSHRRDDRRWKGFIELPLSVDDATAVQWLASYDTHAVPGVVNNGS